MAGANTLHPIVMPESAPARAFSRGKFGMLGTAAWLCLAGMGSSQPLLHASPAPASSEPCRILQRTPLYVGFPDEVGLDSFEETALASRKIVREVKHWVCDESTSTAVAVPSLQLAFAQRAPIRLDRVQFDDAALARAHVVLSSLAANSGLSRWRVDLTHATEAGWAVTGTGIATARDLEDASGDTR